jgi:hypothetical protein
MLWHAACKLQGKHQIDALKKYKEEIDNEFIKRWISRSRRLETRRRNYQHDSYLLIALLAARILYALILCNILNFIKRRVSFRERVFLYEK